jgi:predicted  nucleic acid-binding Zn-ribbon protein
MSVSKLKMDYKMIKLRHDALDKKIVEAYNEVNEMRSQQLTLKEEMTRLEQEIGLDHGKRIPSRF